MRFVGPHSKGNGGHLGLAPCGRKPPWFVALLLLALVFSGVDRMVRAQGETTGALAGQVTDPSSAQWTRYPTEVCCPFLHQA
jgi:hypothetical protein